jgi:leucyl/phenylalanyl-tRNA--protein transferase
MSDTNQTLDVDTLCLAYANGYFPMPDPQTGQIYWYNPNPRAIIPLNGFHVSRSLHKRLKRQEFTVSFNKAFAQVMLGCANRKETWINSEFLRAYQILHERGHAHSIEVWKNEALAGGVYGVALGAAFFAESMFHTATDASKVALFHLVEHLRARGFMILEVQFMTPHLKSLGAVTIPSEDYLNLLERAVAKHCKFGS